MLRRLARGVEGTLRRADGFFRDPHVGRRLARGVRTFGTHALEQRLTLASKTATSTAIEDGQ